MSTGPKTHVHIVSATAESADPNVMPLVCLHGFAHGTSVFYTAAAPLAEAYAGPHGAGLYIGYLFFHT